MKKWNISAIRNLKKDQLLIILLAGVLLVVIAWPVGSSSDDEGTDVTHLESQEGDGDDTYETAYEAELEARLKEILGKVDGVGEVEVMITLKSSSEKVVEKDTESTRDTTTEVDSEGGSRETQSSSDGEETLYTEEDGAQIPYVVKEITPEIEGVVVIAEGGDNAVVAADISEAVQALFEVQAHKIKVMKMN